MNLHLRIVAIVLTKNEELHIGRCLESLSLFAENVLVVDSGSTDTTVEIAQRMGARVLVNPWVNHATQMNWAIAQVPSNVDWIIRIDADEVVQPSLAAEILDSLSHLGAGVDGVYVSRRMNFLGKPIHFGGIFPIQVLRIFRNGRGRCENRWMDEHIVVLGKTIKLTGEIVDDNLKSLGWWINKHNGYADREVVDILNGQYGFMPRETIADLRSGQQAAVKRWIKEVLYSRLPTGFRALIYFLYRYVVRLGFLDGREGTAFHFLQGFWYRYLVDLKLREVSQFIKKNKVSPVVAIREVLGIDVLQ